MAPPPVPPFARGLAIGFLAAGAVWAAIVFAQLGHSTSIARWIDGLYLEKTRIASAVEGARIIVIGGSGALFGIRAEQLTRELGVPAVNFAVNGGMDLDYMLYKARQVLREGDLALLAIEYEVYARDPGRLTYLTIEQAMALDPDYLRTLPWHVVVSSALGVDWARLVSPWIGGEKGPPSRPLNPYSAPHLNGFGDTYGNNPVIRKESNREFVRGLPPVMSRVHPDIGEVLGPFVRWCRERGVRVVATHPNVLAQPEDARSPFSVLVRDLAALHESLGVPLLDEPRETMFRPVAFYDSRYHLDRPAAELRTARLAERLGSHVEPMRAHARPVRLPEEDHALAKLQRQFSGWRPVQGFREVEGPFPARNLPAVVWSDVPSATALVVSPVARVARVQAKAQCISRGQALQVEVNGAPVLRSTFAHCRFQAFAFDAPLHAGDNYIVFRHSGVVKRSKDPRPLGLLFSELRVE